MWLPLRSVSFLIFALILLFLPGLTRNASGTSGTNVCPCLAAVCVAGLGENDAYELIKHGPPQSYSIVSRCGGQNGMVWAETPFTEDDELDGLERPNYLRARLGYRQGTLIVVETQIPLRALENLGSRRGLGELEHVKGVQIDHIDVIYSPGHWGVPEPHYDVQEYLVGHTDHQFFECQPRVERGWFQFISLFN